MHQLNYEIIVIAKQLLDIAKMPFTLYWSLIHTQTPQLRKNDWCKNTGFKKPIAMVP